MSLMHWKKTMRVWWFRIDVNKNLIQTHLTAPRNKKTCIFGICSKGLPSWLLDVWFFDGMLKQGNSWQVSCKVPTTTLGGFFSLIVLLSIVASLSTAEYRYSTLSSAPEELGKLFCLIAPSAGQPRFFLFSCRLHLDHTSINDFLLVFLRMTVGLLFKPWLRRKSNEHCFWRYSRTCLLESSPVGRDADEDFPKLSPWDFVFDLW